MLLKKGSKGEDVKKVQKLLGLTTDGDFGANTDKAVKNWQLKNGLTPDGIVGENTWNKMFPKTLITEPSTVHNNTQLNIENLRGKIPDKVFNQITDAVTTFKINTNLRLAHFLAQCAHESANFKLVEENLNYSKEALDRVFGKYFPDNLSESYAKQPERIGSRVYGNRMGNGTEESKEGFKFRGRGYIQLTGKDNYKAFGQSINEDVLSNPDLVASKYPLLSAAWFFQRCLPKCDMGSSTEAITAVTKCVNGGTNGLDERIEYFKKFYDLLT